MKKSILTAIVAVAAVSGAIGYQSQQTAESQLSAVEMANLEALSSGEGPDYDAACIGTGKGCSTAPNVWIKDSGYVAPIY